MSGRLVLLPGPAVQPARSAICAYDGVSNWRRFFLERLTKIAERYPPRIEVELDALADMAKTLVDGGIIMSRLMRDKKILPQQIMLYRDYVRAVFLGA